MLAMLTKEGSEPALCLHHSVHNGGQFRGGFQRNPATATRPHAEALKKSILFFQSKLVNNI